MENIKNLKEIKEMLHERNEYWWKEERPDLDLKYYIPTDVMCDSLAYYERGLTEEEYKAIYKENRQSTRTFFSYDEYDYFTNEGMEKWQENDYLIQHLTETQLELLVEYDTEKCLMKDIIDFVIFQTENEFKVYPLVLDTFIVYDMIVDFAEENDMIYVECLNCGALQYVKRTEIQEDDKGEYVTCYQCNATFDIDNVKKGE